MSKKQIANIMVLILVFGFGGALLHANGKDAVSASAEKKESLLAAEQINVSFQQVGGRVIDIPIKEGQFIKQGTVLMQLDTRDIDLQIEQYKIQINKADVQIELANTSLGSEDVNKQQYAIQLAQETLANAKKTFERVNTLHSQGACSTAALDDAQLKLSSAENAVSQNQELLQKYQNNLETARLNVTIAQEQKKMLEVQLQSLLDQKNRMLLKAPSDGTILSVIPKVGENVTASSTVLLLQSNDLYFDLYVPETQVDNFYVGKPVSVYVVTLNKTIPGIVQFIMSAPQYTSMRMSRDNAQGDLSTYRVRINLDKDAKDLLSGMTVEVRTDETI